MTCYGTNSVSHVWSEVWRFKMAVVTCHVTIDMPVKSFETWEVPGWSGQADGWRALLLVRTCWSARPLSFPRLHLIIIIIMMMMMHHDEDEDNDDDDGDGDPSFGISCHSKHCVIYDWLIVTHCWFQFSSISKSAIGQRPKEKMPIAFLWFWTASHKLLLIFFRGNFYPLFFSVFSLKSSNKKDCVKFSFFFF